jgi:acetyl esterase/lipase
MDVTVAALNAVSGSDQVSERKDLRYGPGPRNTYDLYTPDGATAQTPLLVFVHGGSWHDGDKGIYRFLGTAFGDADIEVAVINYHLGPDAIFPSYPQDTALAVTHFLEERPGQPIFLMGHSAGAQMAALTAYDPRYLDALGHSPCDLSGIVGVSGPYDFLPLDQARFFVIFPEDTRAQTQPINYANGPNPPSLLIHSRDDVTVHVEDTELMADALRTQGQRVTTAYYDDAGHIDIISGISRYLRDNADTFEDTLSFVRAEAAAGYPGCVSNS